MRCVAASLSRGFECVFTLSALYCGCLKGWGFFCFHGPFKEDQSLNLARLLSSCECFIASLPFVTSFYSPLLCKIGIPPALCWFQVSLARQVSVGTQFFLELAACELAGDQGLAVSKVVAVVPPWCLHSKRWMQTDAVLICISYLFLTATDQPSALFHFCFIYYFHVKLQNNNDLKKWDCNINHLC